MWSLNVLDNPVMSIVLDILGIRFVTVTNTDLRPTDQVACMGCIDGRIQQINLRWGIRRPWSKKLLINAQIESITEKKTYKDAYQHQRCVVPCSGWYEWQVAGGKKVKRQFDFPNGCGFLAGVWLAEKEGNRLVTLTVAADDNYVKDRMPLVIEPSKVELWLEGGVENKPRE